MEPQGERANSVAHRLLSPVRMTRMAAVTPSQVAATALGVLSIAGVACASIPSPVPMLPEPDEAALFGMSMGNVRSKKEAVVTSAATGEVHLKDNWNGYPPGWPAFVDPRFWLTGPVSEKTVLAAHLSWLAAGVQSHFAPRGFSGSLPWLLSVGLQAGLGEPFAYEVRAGASIHPRPARFIQFMLGASASAGTRRWTLPVSGELTMDYADNIWGSELRIARPEARVEGLLGTSFLLGHAVRVGLAAQPFYIVATGNPSMDCYLCSQDDVSLTSFQANWGLAFQASISFILFERAP